MNRALLMKIANAYELEEILENYDKDRFLEWIKAEADDRYSLDAVMGLDQANKLVYRKLINKFSTQIIDDMSSGISLPFPATQRAFEEMGLPMPNTFLAKFTSELALDAYFGAIYHPGRFTSTYENGAKEILENILRQIPWAKVVKEVSKENQYYVTSLCVASPENMADLWGWDTLRNWWTTSKDKEVEKFIKGFTSYSGLNEEIRDYFIAAFGARG